MATPNKVSLEVLAEVFRRWNLGESQGQIAEALGLNRGTVATHLRRNLEVSTPRAWGGGRRSLQRTRKTKALPPPVEYPDNPPKVSMPCELSPGESARFWSKVAAPNETGCRLWLASCKPDGSGQFGTAISPSESSYRVAWRLAYGPIPEGKQINHRCDVRACNEPTHLWLGTQAENLADMAAKGRRLGRGGIPGEDNVTAKLTWEIVREIRHVRENQGLTVKQLATRFKISPSQVSNIINHRQWIE